jgi:spore coat polysaccharide biosynthesis protein SpsF
MKIGAIVQARTGSTRLPGKILKELPYGSNITVLEQVIARLTKCKKLQEIIIATTVKKEDDVIVNIAEKSHLKWFRGNVEDVLSRYYLAARENNLDAIARITSDCPCIDVDIVDLIIQKHIETVADYTSNTITRTYPHGLDVEVFTFDSLEKAHKNAQKVYEREHVTPYIYMNNDIFKITQMRAPKNVHMPEARIVLDTEEDYALLCVIYDHLYSKNIFFNALDIVNLFKEKPWLNIINKKIIQKEIFNTLKGES